MNDYQLYIKGYLVAFASDQSAIQLILQVNDLGNLQSLQGNTSKEFGLILTKELKEILGFPDDITLTDNTPYEQLPSKLIISGIEIVANGLIEIVNVQNNIANVKLLFGNIDLLDKLGGQIYDMGDSTTPWSGYGTNLVWNAYSLPFPNDINNLANCIWDVLHAANSQRKTDGWIWPVVNYGNLDLTPPFAGHINVRTQRPGFFLHTAIELLIKSTGYAINYAQSCIYNDPDFADLYQKLIIQFSNSDFEHGTDFQNTPDNLGVTLFNGQDQIISKPRIFPPPNNDIYLNDQPYDTVLVFGPTDHYTAATNVNFTATLHFNLFMRGRQGGNQPSEVIVKFTLVDVDGGITDFASTSFFLVGNNTTYVEGNGNSKICQFEFINQKLSQDFSLVTGMKLYARCHINNIGTDKSTDTYVIFRNSATFTIVTNEQTLLWQQPIQCERILPNVAQLDLLKDTLQRFGLILISDPNTATIIFTSFKTIVGNIPIARDWSDKCKDIGKQNAFQLGNYSQVNKLKYQDDGAIPRNYMPQYFADDQIAINDKTLNPTQPIQDLFTSIFAPSLNSPYIGGTIAQMSNPTDTSEFSVGNQPRLLIDEKLDLSTAGPNGSPLTVIFSDGDPGFETVTIPVNDVISVPYFYKQDGDFNLAWKDLPGQGVKFNGQQNYLPGLKTKYFQELTNILTQTKKVTRYFYLTPRDILDFDFTIPVYVRQDSAYYYVSKIDSWIKGQPCKVDLIQINK
ncbi:MAG: hypothetical protein P4L31_07455 [Candidatus Babeliales bacterium]|nr:hypothetical protein [Candidatus Babeliales bacterium]